jgi:ribosomal protein L37AE/L43A
MLGSMADQGSLDSMQPFDCPRCARTVVERLYGPCESCRAELRATVTGEARAVETEQYVPKMNVTPNAVATKD